jgi:uncharacterized SAM-binding protein YcdF (DUF218 family)
MTQEVSRTLQALLLPPGGFIILMALGLFVSGICRCFGRFLIAAGLFLLYAVSIGPVADSLIIPLESAYPPLQDPVAKTDADAVVVLSGGVHDLSWRGLPPEASETSLERLVSGIRIARAARVPLVLAGGSGDPAKAGVSEADAMARAASGLGVSGRDMIVVAEGWNTLESARAVKRRLPGSRIVLVTSASHMKRAAGFFRKQGFTVIAASCGFRGERMKRSMNSLVPSAGNLSESSTALSEYLSIVWYTMKGEL